MPALLPLTFDRRVLGGLIGVGCAWLAVPILASQISLGYKPILIDAHPDARVLGLAVALTVTAGSWPVSCRRSV